MSESETSLGHLPSQITQTEAPGSGFAINEVFSPLPSSSDDNLPIISKKKFNPLSYLYQTVPSQTGSSSLSTMTRLHEYSTCLWKSRNLNNKTAFIQTLIYTKSPDIFALTETWLSSSMYDKKYIPQDNVFTTKTENHWVLF